VCQYFSSSEDTYGCCFHIGSITSVLLLFCLNYCLFEYGDEYSYLWNTDVWICYIVYLTVFDILVLVELFVVRYGRSYVLFTVH